MPVLLGAYKLIASVQRTLGIGDEVPQSALIISQLGNILVLQRKTKEATVVYAELDKAIAQWTPPQREVFELNGSRIVALYESGRVAAGIAAAEELVKRTSALTGEKSFDKAAARGTLAIGYARTGRDNDAIPEFRAAIPIITTTARENADEDDPTVVAARNARLQRIVETYISVPVRQTDRSGDLVVETFALADAIRGHAVQQALADGSARGHVVTGNAGGVVSRSDRVPAAKSINPTRLSNVLRYFAVPLILLLVAHHLIINVFDLRIEYLWIACAVVPFAFGFIFFWAPDRHSPSQPPSASSRFSA